MELNELREVIRQMIMEQVDPVIEAKIDEFGELSNEMDRLNHQLKALKKKYGTLEDELRPVMDELAKTNQKSIQTQKYLLTIKKRGYESTRYKYADAFKLALTKVNAQTRKILEEAKEQTGEVAKYATKLGVQPAENWVTDILKKIGNMFKGIISKFRRVNKDMDTLQKISKKMLK